MSFQGHWEEQFQRFVQLMQVEDASKPAAVTSSFGEWTDDERSALVALSNRVRVHAGSAACWTQAGVSPRWLAMTSCALVCGNPLCQALVVPAESVRVLLCSLVTIVFGYAYDQRCTQGEGTPESAWLVAVLSATLSWFEEFDDPREAVLAG